MRRQGRDILGPLDLTLDATGFTMVIGPNGAGKSTLLKALHGVERVSAGTLTWSAPDDDVHARQSFVFQTPVMLRRTVRENLRYPLSLTGVPKAQIDDRIHHWASLIGLTDHLGQSALRLSGGERQKLSLARALITEPELLFLDEPCTNLDGRATRDIEILLLEAYAKGTRIVMATHDLGQARRLATDALFLVRGALRETGKASTFFEHPQTDELQAFLKGEIVE
ncbi:ATP-binding cassette domain-containing protein [Sulfitobacter aestuariivivens]|uniref:ATP-binding cassette domain-containing protein n=1 Tax=Sulfitobacter aestuariivivens TaxID=2766981 RepID=UPI00361A3530